jgi:hypothetical protein
MEAGWHPRDVQREVRAMSDTSIDTRSRVHRPDQTVYFVLDDFGPIGMIWRGADIERISIKAVIADLLINSIAIRFASLASI